MGRKQPFWVITSLEKGSVSVRFMALPHVTYCFQGNGSFGDVRLAQHVRTGLQVAVKILNKKR